MPITDPKVKYPGTYQGDKTLEFDGGPNWKPPVEISPVKGRFLDPKAVAVKAEDDPVNHPSHYTTGNIEVIDFIEDQKLPYHLACVVKYLCRAPYKGKYDQDMAKAGWYWNRWVEGIQKGTLKDERVSSE